MTNAQNMKWNSNHFDQSEFPSNSLEHISAKFMRRLFAFRELTGVPMTPSPNPDGWARFTGSKGSRHYAVRRLSDAGDLFPAEDADIRLLLVQACQMFNGFGFYLDTKLNGKSRTMIHLDQRPMPLVWARYRGEYIYPSNSRKDSDRFFYLLNNAGRIVNASQ